MLNPGYEIKYYNGHDCEQYLLKYYGEEYVSIYRRINAYSGKCNFMRACIVYNEGGWYSDWKQVCLRPLDEFDLNNIRWVSAFDLPNEFKRTFMMTAFFGSEPKHILLQQYIKNIINNVKTKYYGENVLDTTGPGCFGKSYDQLKDTLNKKTIILGQFKKDFYFYFFGKQWVLHKCEKCSKGPDWSHGNNYYQLWKDRKYYK